MTTGRASLFSGILASLLATGCGSTATLKRFDTFATAGCAYAKAMEKVIDDTSGLLIDANSAQLLASEAVAPVDSSELLEQDEAMRKQVRDLRLLKRQAQLLGRYFETLAKLAEKDESEQVASEVSDLGRTLSDVANAAGKGSDLLKDGDVVAEVTSMITKEVVKGVHAGRLRDELEDRGAVIATVLRQQADALKTLAQQAEEAQAYLEQGGYQETVAAPLLSADPIPEDGWPEWIENRRAALEAAPVPDSLRQAFDAAVSLRAAWTGLLANELDEDELQELASQVASLAAATPADQ